MVEIAFISNPTEESLLASPDFRARATRAIAEGVAEFLCLALEPAPPPAGPNVVKIIVSGVILEGILINDHTCAPVQALAEALGRTVRWDEETRMVVIE